MIPLKVYVDPDLCISCGACIDLCPEVFDWNEEGIAEAQVDEVPKEFEDLVQEALESCPTSAIIGEDISNADEEEDVLSMEEEKEE
ncbi:MAG: 4Fe-4S ferredoxin iron-sulfur binding protein [Clostridia bacterium 41_269]|nr:MAG: 4Fe-4S ferredoxin iron-sulfur binding protein [Clostridia bacterium 41_269]